ncbi:hypothetical protein ACTVPQ_24550 [Serratia bockelmannii]|uniref:hypothetical protein n=1 Tax=Serratia bockelmannii TaxID=2703793 RepID=UPI003FA7C1B5
MFHSFKKSILISLILGAGITLAGCKDDKGKAFVGHWYQLTDSKKPTDISIDYDSGVFHVNINANSWTPEKGIGYVVKKTEAKAESDNVLNVLDGSGTMRLENNKLLYKGDTYSKK